MNTYKYHKLTRKIIKRYYEVYNELGTGFLESVYEKAMVIELSKELRLDVTSQVPIDVSFKGQFVGKFMADLIVENKIIVELKGCLAVNSRT